MAKKKARSCPGGDEQPRRVKLLIIHYGCCSCCCHSCHCSCACPSRCLRRHCPALDTPSGSCTVGISRMESVSNSEGWSESKSKSHSVSHGYGYIESEGRSDEV